MTSSVCYKVYDRDFQIEPESVQFANCVFDDEYRINDLRPHNVRTELFEAVRRTESTQLVMGKNSAKRCGQILGRVRPLLFTHLVYLSGGGETRQKIGYDLIR